MFDFRRFRFSNRSYLTGGVLNVNDNNMSAE
jgi:hypothetical protein